MKHVILLAAACSAMLAGCATGTQEGARQAAPEETYVPTGSSIARRSVDRNSAVKTANKEELENARLMGAATNLPQN